MLMNQSYLRITLTFILVSSSFVSSDQRERSDVSLPTRRYLHKIGEDDVTPISLNGSEAQSSKKGKVAHEILNLERRSKEKNEGKETESLDEDNAGKEKKDRKQTKEDRKKLKGEGKSDEAKGEDQDNEKKKGGNILKDRKRDKKDNEAVKTKEKTSKDEKKSVTRPVKTSESTSGKKEGKKDRTLKREKHKKKIESKLDANKVKKSSTKSPVPTISTTVRSPSTTASNGTKSTSAATITTSSVSFSGAQSLMSSTQTTLSNQTLAPSITTLAVTGSSVSTLSPSTNTTTSGSVVTTTVVNLSVVKHHGHKVKFVTKNRCPTAFQTVDGIDPGKCFHVMNVRSGQVGFRHADNYCRVYMARRTNRWDQVFLFRPKTKEEIEAVVDWVFEFGPEIKPERQDSPGIWLGFKRAQKQQFVDYITGEPVPVGLWMRGKPYDTGSRQCVCRGDLFDIQRVGMEDVACENERQFNYVVCETQRDVKVTLKQDYEFDYDYSFHG